MIITLEQSGVKATLELHNGINVVGGLAGLTAQMHKFHDVFI